MHDNLIPTPSELEQEMQELLKKQKAVSRIVEEMRRAATPDKPFAFSIAVTPEEYDQRTLLTTLFEKKG